MKDLKTIAEKIIEKERKVAKRNADKIPYTTSTPHVFDDWSSEDKINWWTNGFWGGMMWQLYNATHEDIFKEIAISVEDKLDRVLMSHIGLDHDNGFKWLPTSVAHFRLDNDHEAYNRAMLAAGNLAGRFNANGCFIRAWNDPGDGSKNTTGWAIIDCMMNLPLLYWASEKTKDPRFKAIAVAHADTAMKNFVREDGSVRHIVEFDPENGEYVRDYGGQGMARGSSWTRGQSWALYGFTLSYIHTGNEDYLKTAIRIADRFYERMPKDRLMPVDFDQPADSANYDSTAAAIAACGFIALSDVCKNIETDVSGKSGTYREAAERLIGLIDEFDCDYDPDHDELLTMCSAAWSDEKHNFPIIYGDYFYIEAIWKLTGNELFIW
ncbi:MAG: glycoside hydrolase family 88 protein [Lachnospiraceae bacterium]|nr:glycoside hydrolase family 88 protein [Lachnospiraceae bacterium]